jgi:hypothetical protein
MSDEIEIVPMPDEERATIDPTAWMKLPHELDEIVLDDVLALVRRTRLENLTREESMQLHTSLEGRPWVPKVDTVRPLAEGDDRTTAYAIATPHVLQVRAELLALAGLS